MTVPLTAESAPMLGVMVANQLIVGLLVGFLLGVLLAPCVDNAYVTAIKSYLNINFWYRDAAWQVQSAGQAAAAVGAAAAMPAAVRRAPFLIPLLQFFGAAVRQSAVAVD